MKVTFEATYRLYCIYFPIESKSKGNQSEQGQSYEFLFGASCGTHIYIHIFFYLISYIYKHKKKKKKTKRKKGALYFQSKLYLMTIFHKIKFIFSIFIVKFLKNFIFNTNYQNFQILY